VNTPGSGYSLAAAATGLTGATSSAFTVNVGPASRLVFGAYPLSGGVAGVPLGEISAAYLVLVDVKLNRVHAGVVTAHPVDEALARDITARLQDAVRKTVVPHFDTDPRLLGGVIVRIGDRVFDGSLRRRMRLLRHRLLHAAPTSPPGGATD